MFWWIVGGIVLFYVFTMLMVLALCKAASDADDWTERWYAEQQQQKQKEEVAMELRGNNV